LDPDPIRIRIQSVSGSNPYPDPIRIRIQSVSGSNPYPDPIRIQSVSGTRSVPVFGSNPIRMISRIRPDTEYEKLPYRWDGVTFSYYRYRYGIHYEVSKFLQKYELLFTCRFNNMSSYWKECAARSGWRCYREHA
jgi:hypothetical protein